MSCHRVICRGPISIYPRTEYLVGQIVVVVLNVVYHNEVGRRKAPEAACPWTVGIDVIGLVNTPVVSSIPGEFSGVIALGAKVPGTFILWRTGIGIFHGIFIYAEVYLM